MHLVAGPSARLPGHEGEELVGAAGSAVRRAAAPSAVLRVHAAVRDRRHRVVLPEEELAGVVGEGDALARDLEVDGGGQGQRPRQEQLGHRLPHRLKEEEREEEREE